MNSITKILILPVLGIILLAIFATSFTSNQSDAVLKAYLRNTENKKPEQLDTLSIIGVGDMMLGTNYPSESYLPPNDGKDILKPVHYILQNADLTFGNLEGCLLTSGGYPKKCSDPSKCYAFRMPEHYVNYLKEAGFDALSLANNHMGDFGDPGRTKTVEMLKSTGINFAGLLAYPKSVFELNGVKYGLCAFAPNSGTVSLNDVANAVKIVEQLEKEADIVIVSFHGGAEGSKYRNVTRKQETFYGENRGNVYEFAHKVIDAGADIVFGHGPHVTRAVELYNNRIIAYSLGNFCTYGRFSLDGLKGIAPILKVFIKSNGEFISAKIYPIIQKGEGGPTLDPNNKVIKEIKDLTSSDFPETSIVIQDDGWIKRK